MNEKLEIALDSRERSLVTGGPLSGLPALLEGEREVFLVYDRNVEKVAEGIMEACPGIFGMMRLGLQAWRPVRQCPHDPPFTG